MREDVYIKLGRGALIGAIREVLLAAGEPVGDKFCGEGRFIGKENGEWIVSSDLLEDWTTEITIHDVLEWDD